MISVFYLFYLFFFFFLMIRRPPRSTLFPLHDALPICRVGWCQRRSASAPVTRPDGNSDRKSTRLNSSHVAISYAVFCLKKKTNLRSTWLSFAANDESDAYTYAFVVT